MKFLLPVFFLMALRSFAQDVDTNYLQNLYAIGMNMDESKIDSIRYYANRLSESSKKLNYPLAKIYSLRLYGYYFENKGEYEKAIDFYLQTLDSSRKLNETGFEIAALTDLAAVYNSDLKQPQEAKEVYLQCVELNKKIGDASSLVASYTNLAAIYNRLNYYDSALIFLQEGLRIGKPLEEKGEDLSALYNNLGNTYFSKKEYDQSLVWFRKNFDKHINQNDPGDTWLDELNLADVYIEKSIFDSARKYAGSAFAIAQQLNSDSKKADSYSILAKLYKHEGDYKKAYGYLENWYMLDTSLVNGETYRVIAELQQKFQTRERENEKLLLEAEVVQQKFHNRIILLTAIGLLITASLIAIALFIKRKANIKLQATNELVIRQNEKLSELNYEKNSLISIVSHDLGTPFASIGMWNQFLENGNGNLNEEQKKAVDKIRQSTSYGEKLIRNILDVEKAQTNQHKLNLENFDLKTCAESVIENFEQVAEKKDIKIFIEAGGPGPVYLISDQQLMTRIFENLLSNAIKYTLPGKKVWLKITDEKGLVTIYIKDEGVGIEKEQLPFLFAKYSKISSRPTNNEVSTGLGLSIVKRIVEELNGSISCDSEPGKGSVFTIVFKK